MQETKGDLWALHRRGSWVAVPTNGIVKSNGEAVMGRGVALQARFLYRELPTQLGAYLKCYGNRVFVFSGWRIMTFPTKDDWKEPAKLPLIVQSAEQLMAAIRARKIRRIYLPRPGCGNGQLTWEQVQPAIAPILDDRVIILERG